MVFPRSRRIAALASMAGVGALMVAAGFARAETEITQDLASHDPGPTFYTDVFPILQRNCQACHQPAGLNLGGMVAPMSLVTYEETRAWAPIIAEAVKERRMPPWHAAPEFYGKFENERYLDPQEKETLLAWAEAGAPEGQKPAGWTAPEPPKPTGDGTVWSIGEPDIIVGFNEPHFLDDDVHDIYVNINIKIDEDQLPEDRWIRAVEFIPGGPHVHHVIASPLGGIAPGYEPLVYREGYSQLLRKGTEVTFQMHYHKQPGPGTAVEDMTKAAVIFYEPGEVIRHVVRSEPLGIFDFLIPPGAKDYTRSLEHTFSQDSYILSFNPHMHYRGKAAKFELTYPDGRHEVLLHVPNYDFGWQHTYDFREPVFAPEGSTLKMTLWWDNSADNPHNPDPTVPVHWGQPTTDEMGFGFMRWTEAEPRNIVVGEPIPDDVLRTRDSLLDGTAIPADQIRRLQQLQQQLRQQRNQD